MIIGDAFLKYLLLLLLLLLFFFSSPFFSLQIVSLKSGLGKIWLFVTNFSFIPDSVFNDKVGVVTASSEIIIFFIY